MITDLMEIIQPPLSSQETRPSKRTRTGLSVEEREARAAFQLMKDEKRKEIAEFMQNSKVHRTTQWSGVCGALCAEATSVL